MEPTTAPNASPQGAPDGRRSRRRGIAAVAAVTLLAAGGGTAPVFSEPLDRATVGTTTTVTFRDPNGGGNDSVSIAQLTNGFRSLGANGYVSTNNTTYAFAASPISWSNGDRTVTVTLGPTCSGTCTAIGTQPTNATLSFQPATTIRDTAGNLILTTTRSSSIRLF
jgi:hypothetical protein